MGVQAKIINMLLYDSTLSGVIRIEDSNWNSGELFSAPRDSVTDLLDTGACKKYGVYLLLSPEMVYIGQSSDLARRITQHIAGKDWWESVIILTTKDDSLNQSDIDYLENVLIDKAFAIQKLDCDNKKRGNPAKVDIFKRTLLNQYLEEALFLMQLIGVRVFAQNAVKKRRSRKNSSPKPSIELVSLSNQETKNTQRIPPLPDEGLKIGEFVYSAMRRLSDSGYVFTEEQINEMASPEWTKIVFHTIHPFMKKFTPGETDNKGTDGHIRFKSEPFTFGGIMVLISKEWYDRQRQYFIDWYASLR